MSFDRGLVDVEDFLLALGIRNVKRSGDEVSFSCPFPEHAFGDTHPSASMNVDSTAVHCFTCKFGGDAVTFLAKLEGVSPILASRWLAERYDPGGYGGSAQEALDRVLAKPQGEQPSTFWTPISEKVPGLIEIEWQTVADTLMSLHADKVPGYLRYPLQRGFGVETLEHFGWAYDSFTDRMAFRIHDEKGNAVGLKARAWRDGDGNKYIAIGDTPRSGSKRKRGFPPFVSGNVLFNLHNAIHDGRQPFVLVEGELNAMMIRQIANETTDGMVESPVVGLPGSSLSKHQELMLRRYAEGVVLFFDSDEAGRRALWGYPDAQGRHVPGIVERLRPYMPVWVVEEHEGDACSLTPDATLDLIVDAPSATLSSLRFT